MNKQKPNLFKYTWPIFIEFLLQILIGNVDQMQIAFDSQKGVAAIGNANQIFNFLIIMFSVISLAMSILVTQYIGSKADSNKISETYTLSIITNFVIGVVIAVVLILSCNSLFQMMNVPAEILADTKTYLIIVGLGLPIQAVYTTYVTMFRTQGWMKQTMVVSTFINLLNIVGNFLLIYGIGPFPALHVAGVAISSVVSRTVGLVILMLYFKRHTLYEIGVKYLHQGSKKQLRTILNIGLPSGGENLSYNLSQIFIQTYVNRFGTSIINTKVYTSIFVMFAYAFGAAISQASQIIVGMLVGAKEYEDADRQVMQATKWSVLIGMSIAAICFLGSDYIFSLFTTDPIVYKIGKQILFIEIFLEAGRAVNMTMVRSLQATGDIKYPVGLGIFSMWTISVGLSFLFGIVFNWGLVGIWLAMAIDEVFRAVLFIIRWKKGDWKNRQLITN